MVIGSLISIQSLFIVRHCFIVVAPILKFLFLLYWCYDVYDVYDAYDVLLCLDFYFKCDVCLFVLGDNCYLLLIFFSFVFSFGTMAHLFC